MRATAAPRWRTDISGWILIGWRIPAQTLGMGAIASINSENVREMFFRVTGKPFNSLKPPVSRPGGPCWRAGGSTRGGRFRRSRGRRRCGGAAEASGPGGVALRRSCGFHLAASAMASGRWFSKTTASIAKEARCQVKLPRDGRVSRLTLWVNGEPREAAFSTVSKVKAAYKAVAVVQRRDPVLVNVVGPDTVMVQCFPGAAPMAR